MLIQTCKWSYKKTLLHYVTWWSSHPWEAKSFIQMAKNFSALYGTRRFISLHNNPSRVPIPNRIGPVRPDIQSHPRIWSDRIYRLICNNWPLSSHHYQTFSILILDNDQLNAQLFYFTIHLLQFSTYFEHYMLIIKRLNCIDAASGIVNLSQWPSGAQVEEELVGVRGLTRTLSAEVSKSK